MDACHSARMTYDGNYELETATTHLLSTEYDRYISNLKTTSDTLKQKLRSMPTPHTHFSEE